MEDISEQPSEEPKPFVLGVAGATGSGKSTLAYGLQDKFPGKVAVLHLDDYFIPKEQMSDMAGFKNWDDPESLKYKQFASELSKLISGQTITVDTKSARLNPDYYKTQKYKTVEIEPKPLIVVDGFLLLHYPGLRELLDKSVFLNAPFEIHSNRRVHPAEQEYKNNVIRPMVEKYVVPSSVHADLVIDVVENGQDEVLSQVIEILPPALSLHVV
jgi:uridine kinase